MTGILCGWAWVAIGAGFGVGVIYYDVIHARLRRWMGAGQ